MNWTQEEAIKLCTDIEKFCPQHGCHVAMTGGCLYGGSCKDLDLIFYRVRQRKHIDELGLLCALDKFGIQTITTHKLLKSWVTKAVDLEGRTIDLMFPENKEGDYIDD
jgi:hypothetical protein